MIQNTQGNTRKFRVRASDRLRVHFLSLARRVAEWRRPQSSSHSGTLSIGVASPEPRCGCSTVAFNLAAGLAGIAGGNVLYVEANFGKPNIARRIPRPAHGLSEILLGNSTLQGALLETSIDRLWLLGPGRARIHEVSDLSFNVLDNLNADLSDDFDYVIYDLPVASDSTNCFAIAAHLDAVLIVADANDVREDLINTANRRFESVGASVIGIVLNKA